MFDFAALKAQARQTVHDTLSVPATFVSKDMMTRAELRVRWINKIVINGDIVETGYAEMIEGVDRCVFNQLELNEQSITLQRGDMLTMWDSAVLILDSQEPPTGPVEVIWRVVRK